MQLFGRKKQKQKRTQPPVDDVLKAIYVIFADFLSKWEPGCLFTSKICFFQLFLIFLICQKKELLRGMSFFCEINAIRKQSITVKMPKFENDFLENESLSHKMI